MQTEPTNEELSGAFLNSCLSAAFNEDRYGVPTKSSVDALAILRSKRNNWFGIDDQFLRSEIDSHIKANTQ